MATAYENWQHFAVSWAQQHGGYDPRRAPGPVRRWQRLGYGVGRVLTALRTPPIAVTLAVLAAAVAVPYLAGRGGQWPLVAACLVLLATFGGTVETVLGVLHRQRVAALREAVAGRLREVAWLVALWLLGVPGPLLVACGVLTGLHEYVRVQTFATGLSRIGVQTSGDRPMRVAVTASALALAGLAGDGMGAGIATVAGAVWLLLAALGLGQLIGAVRRSLG